MDFVFLIAIFKLIFKYKVPLFFCFVSDLVVFKEQRKSKETF